MDCVRKVTGVSMLFWTGISAQLTRWDDEPSVRQVPLVPGMDAAGLPLQVLSGKYLNVNADVGDADSQSHANDAESPAGKQGLSFGSRMKLFGPVQVDEPSNSLEGGGGWRVAGGKDVSRASAKRGRRRQVVLERT